MIPLRLLQLFVIALPFEDLWKVLLDVDTPFKPYRLVGLLILVVAILGLTGRRSRIRLDYFDRAHLTIVVYGLLMAVLWKISSGSGQLGSALSDVSLIVFGLSVAICAKASIEKQAHAELLLDSFQVATLSSVGIYLLLGNSLAENRLAGFYENPNSYAAAMAAAIIVALSKVLFPRNRSPLNYIYNCLSILVLAIAILYTGSRGPILAVVVSLFAFAVPLLKRRGKGTAGQKAVLMMPVLLAGALLIRDTVQAQKETVAFARYDMSVAEDGSGRRDIWRSALLVATDHYFLGVGVGQYRHYHQQYTKSLDAVFNKKMKRSNLTTHNEFINLLTAYGVLGLVLYILVLRRLYSDIVRAVSLSSRMSCGLAACLPLLALFLVTQMTHNTFASPQYYLLIGIVVRLSSSDGLRSTN